MAMAKETSNEAGVHLWLIMMKAHKTLERHAERSIRAIDMCLSDFAVLELLLHKGPQKVNDIGRRIELTSGSISTAVDRLEKRELVVRTFEKDDRRARVVRLTPRGKSRINEVFATHVVAMEEAAKGLTKTERATLAHLMKKLGTSAEQKLKEMRDVGND
jgi:MarR family transcriptional regulator, 2-MHQ and catechol-resistance regulon repressor